MRTETSTNPTKPTHLPSDGPFAMFTEVVSSYRVEPFYTDEVLVVDRCFKMGKGKKVTWRIRVYSKDRQGISGFLDADTLTEV